MTATAVPTSAAPSRGTDRPAGAPTAPAGPVSERLTAATAGRGAETVLQSARGSWSGAELDRVTRTVAAGLRAMGAGRDTVVELHTDDHVEAVVLMVATLRAGAAFCVVPPSYPPARVAAIRARTRPVVVLDGLADALALPGDPDAGLPVRGDDDLAYVIFTSGSTGDPKAVEITDRCVRHLADQPGIYPGRTVAHLAALQFDACIYEILGGLLNGLTVRVLDTDDVMDRHRAPVALRGVDVLFVTTQVFNLLVDRSPEALDAVELVVFGGERVSPRHVRAALGRCRVVHAYGPTETTVFATLHEVQEVPDGADVPIGTGLVGSCLHVLADDGTEVVPGVPGELVIGGTGLMRGYRDQPEATAAALVGLHGAPHYRSGDLVTADAAGVVTFVARKDRQLKVSGHRVDPAEIEQEALGYTAPDGRSARSALVVGDEGRLRLFVTGCTDLRGLRAHLRARLPRYLVPVVTAVGFLPLTRNGKTDVTALLARARATTPAEERAREVFAAVVPEIEDPGATFLELGGDSILAMDAVWRLDGLGVLVDMAALLTAPLEEVLRDVR
ncbi:non-ribosomal peptide synthetase [Phycicoccus flavus]|uniref:non-ribosomal peptide synthetase n=1 Tax=Phycicoccus flavus TaxID=2502783 RepID=UPI000FEC03E1|nr:non-ribosomal peptide synthetase [Phycicoccus flavus]NHA67695.1 non-ribosomal peptide synthetase [Phycicoccus flavus]